MFEEQGGWVRFTVGGAKEEKETKAEDEREREEETDYKGEKEKERSPIKRNDTVMVH